MSLTVLKSKHSLVGKSIVPIILKFKAWDTLAEENFTPARLKKEHSLDSYTHVELRSEFEKITGESLKDVMLMTGKDDTKDNIIILLHLAILHANAVGAPKGQLLSVETGHAQPQGPRPSTSGGSGASGSSVPDNVRAVASSDDGDTAQQLKAMRDDLDALKHKRDDIQVDDALATVRSLASRPKITCPNVLLAAIETLKDVAFKTSHKDASMFSKALSVCKKYEDSEDLCSLVLKLFGSPEDKKIASIVDDWAKARKYDRGDKEKGKENVKTGAQNCTTPGFALPHYMPYPPFPYQGQAVPHNFLGMRPPVRSGRPRRGKNSSSCFYCKEVGHFVSNCPRIKKE